MAFVVACSFSAEKRSPALIFTSLFSSASRSSRLPASLTWLILYGSPSCSAIVRDMSFFSGGEGAGELVLRVQIVLRVPREPVRRGKLHLVAQRARADRLVADEVDLADLRARTFSYRKQDLHAVAD